MVTKTDKMIITLLQSDARMPLSKIAKEVGLSENGVKYRLEKMEKERVITRFAVLVDPKKVGKRVKAIFRLELHSADIKNGIKSIKEFEEFTKVYHTSGAYSITAIGLFESNEALAGFINNRLLVECGVKEYTFDIVITQYKDTIYHV